MLCAQPLMHENSGISAEPKSLPHTYPHTIKGFKFNQELNIDCPKSSNSACWGREIPLKEAFFLAYNELMTSN